jgi:Sulfotransferase family
VAARKRKPPIRLRTSRHDDAVSVVASARAVGHGMVRRLTKQSGDGGVQLPAPPPECPPGWRPGPPDFVGIGAQRAGTTRWFRLLGSHPEVASSPLAKELHFFDRFYEGGFEDADVGRYHEYFPRADGLKTGEWTPLYGNAPWVPKMLARAAPDARLLMLVRDPVERLVSGLQHNARVAREQGLPMSRLAPVEAFSRGLYHAQAMSFLGCFDRSRFLLLQYERCLREPLAELRRTLEFVGVSDVDFAPPDLDANPNPQHSKPSLDADTCDSYARAYREDVLALAAEFPELDLALWPNFSELAG